MKFFYSKYLILLAPVLLFLEIFAIFKTEEYFGAWVLLVTAIIMIGNCIVIKRVLNYINKKNKPNTLDKLKKHLANISEEQFRKEWEEIEAMGFEGITVEEFLKNNKIKNGSKKSESNLPR